jgi:hypothetical protein
VSQAAQIQLSDLLNGGTFTTGDKVFSNFTYVPNGDAPPAELVKVTDEGIAANGIRFVGPFIDYPGGTASDALITFDVAVVEGSNMAISEVHLAANPAVLEGPGLANVTETLLPDITTDKLVMWDLGPGKSQQLSDTIVLPHTYKQLSIQKDIILHATGDTAAVTLSFVDQVFTQVPEPASLTLLAMGLFAIGCVRRRQR